MKGGQTLSLKGVLGLCHDVEPGANEVYHVATRLCSNRSAATSERMSIDNIIRHHTGEIIKHQMRHGNVFPFYPRDLNVGL